MNEVVASPQKLRSDKERNRGHILDVAEALFTEQGVAGSLDAIAKRAGVGAGTLYRHFPNREALLAALLHARNDEVETRRRAIETEVDDTVVALDQWLAALRNYVTAFDGLPDPLLVALEVDSSPLAITCEGFVTATEQFLEAAQREGRAQPGVTGRDLFLTVLASAWVQSAALADESSGERMLGIVRQGWSVPGA